MAIIYYPNKKIFTLHTAHTTYQFIGGMNYAVIAQSVERILGKDEVPSSNLGNSSKKACNPKDYRLFYIF